MDWDKDRWCVIQIVAVGDLVQIFAAAAAAAAMILAAMFGFALTVDD